MYRAVLTLVVPGLSTGIAAAADVVAPDWSMGSADGSTVRLSDAVENRPVMFFFWASSCPYCKAPMPHLQSIAIEYGDDVGILALGIRDDGEPAGFIRQRGYSFTALPDADSVAEQYGVHGAPGVFIVDGERLIRFDLKELPRSDVPAAIAARGVSATAACVAPSWAAAIRRRLDDVPGTDRERNGRR